MTNPLDEQQAAHVRCLQDFAAAYDAESANGLALRAAIAALTNPLQFVEFASADALAAWLETLHETDGPAVTGNKFAPAQRAAAAIRAGDTLQPRREVTDDPRVSELIAAVEAFKDLPDVEFTAASTDEAACDRLDAALESFANGGDGNGR